MKIAILGSAPSSVSLAPFKDAAYHKWVQGRIDRLAREQERVPGDFEIWGCSPGCWAVIPRATRWFEVHRWEPGQAWFSPEYCRFLADFEGIVYTGATVPAIRNHVVYPIDRLEEKFSSYNMTSSIGLMLALAIDTLEEIRAQRALHRAQKAGQATSGLTILQGMSRQTFEAELEKPDTDDIIGLWGIDMAAGEEYAYQRPGCQNFVLEAMRRGIGIYLPPESDLMRPKPVYGISEWDHNYIKLTSRAREMNQKMTGHRKMVEENTQQMIGAQGEILALNHFVDTWTSPYGMLPGMVIRQAEGTGLGSGITHYDGRPVERMTVAPPAPTPPPVAAPLAAMAAAEPPAQHVPARAKKAGAKKRRK
jgi:hypothetical protein